MPPLVLPALTRSIRWLVVVAALLIVGACWIYIREGSYWSATVQLLMLALLPFADRQLARLPTQVKFDDGFLYVFWADREDRIPMTDIQAIRFTAATSNGFPIFRLLYTHAAETQSLYVLGGPALQTLSASWQRRQAQ
ncbi:hypothetical protein E5K00_05850 [Hymenobacter aquaticus]|uniref:PH domain-containing protein n=1 Tax=Hymenobacter aquaticus TaxID=1867101 RepID=A0A4Z0Q6E8_9BACT|nr:hypothetical protein [Hymenobacter aquaticus]TGE24733.1 hypothetical protein E5K00_05850 [Hymenobacter aquaticus]